MSNKRFGCFLMKNQKCFLQRAFLVLACKTPMCRKLAFRFNVINKKHYNTLFNKHLEHVHKIYL